MAPVRHDGSMMFTEEKYMDEEKPSMFYCSSDGSDKPNMSKSGILRGIITEKLSTAAREILAVVERTVADYEEEAAGFRREIERQRRQLELLEPLVKEPTTGKKQEETSRNASGRSRDERAETTRRTQGTQSQGSSTVQTGMKGYGKLPYPRTHIDVTVRLLESPEIHILSSVVLRKIPSRVLNCPLDLPESAFLDLLTSSYPQLAAGEPFDILKMKRKPSMRLCPLILKTLTPEEIFAAGNPMLYIRLKRTPVQMGVSEALITESTSADSPVLNNNETGSQTSVAGGADVSDESTQPITSTPQQQEQEAAESHIDSVEPQIHLDEVVTNDRQEAERSAIDVALAPVLTGNHESGVQTSSVGDIRPISSSSEPGNSSTDTDDTSDEEAGCDQDAGGHRQGRTSKVTCRVCGKLFRQLGSLLSHVWDHVDEPHSVCGVCGKTLESAETLRKHLTRHTKGFSLGHFGKDPLSGVGLNRRVAKRQAETRFKCKICSSAFSTMAALRNHSWVHQDRTPIRCHFCLNSFALKADFLAHKKLYASCQGHSCRLCEKAYLSEAMLKEHEKTHGRTDHQQTLSADTSWACGLCDVSFDSKEALKTHMSEHSGEALFECQECGRCFSDAVDFNRHMRTHSVVQPCLCARLRPSD